MAMFRFASFLMLVLGINGVLRADFLRIQVGDGTNYQFTAGQTGVVIPVYMYDSDTTSAISMTSYNLAFDLQGIAGANLGTGTPGFFSNIGAVFNGPLSSGSPLDTTPFSPDAPGYDFIASVSGPSTPVGGNTLLGRVKLFDFVFDVGVATPAGTYGLVFVPGATSFGFATNDVSNFGISQVDGVATFFAVGTGANLNQFTITAVPEPSTMVLVGLMSAGGGAVRFLRRRRAVC